MDMYPDCVPCLMKRVFFQSKLPNNGCERQTMEAALKTYSENISFEKNSAKIATMVHRSAYEAMCVKDPYLELKVNADDIAKSHLGDLSEIIGNSEDPFAEAVRISIIGNIMDFGSGIAIDDPEEFGAIFHNLLEQGIEYNDIDVLKDIMKGSSSVIYLFDNCGEAQFDKLLIREIKLMGKRVVGVAKGQPILNDMSYEDALRIDMDKEVDRLLTTGGFAIGIDLEMIGDDLRKEISEADLIIAKGMANYESLSDVDLGIPITYILKAKCHPVADSIGVSLGSNVVKVRQ